jgi:hypothetical protein
VIIAGELLPVPRDESNEDQQDDEHTGAADAEYLSQRRMIAAPDAAGPAAR